MGLQDVSPGLPSSEMPGSQTLEAIGNLSPWVHQAEQVLRPDTARLLSPPRCPFPDTQTQPVGEVICGPVFPE